VKLGDAIGRNSLVLGLFAVVVTLALAGTQLLTREEIAAQRRAAEARAYSEILPPSRYDNALLDDVRPVEDRELLGLEQPGKILVARRGGQVQAVIVPATAPDGYGGAIGLIVGINADGSVAGVRVVRLAQGDPGARRQDRRAQVALDRGLRGPFARRPRRGAVGGEEGRRRLRPVHRRHDHAARGDRGGEARAAVFRSQPRGAAGAGGNRERTRP